MGKAWYLGHLSAQDAELGGSDGKSHCTFRNKAAGCDVGSLYSRSGVQRESRREGQLGDLTGVLGGKVSRDPCKRKAWGWGRAGSAQAGGFHTL